MPQPFMTFTSRCVPLNEENIDTDQIIPARFLKGTSRTGLRKNLFNDRRYQDDGTPNPAFVLNNPKYAGQILLSGDNFGCGSSREHAPWALTDYGFRAIIASSFADIFKNNALKNNLLPVALKPNEVKALFKAVEANPALEITIDLADQQVLTPQGTLMFDIDPFRKQCLLKGKDDIGYTLGHLNEIEAYEQTHQSTPVSLSLKSQ